MNDRNIHNIKSYLQTEEVQTRISENMLRRRSEVTVTIGRVAELFGFTENQLRDWEDRGLLTPQRSTKQRQYTLSDLDKLTIIRELIDAKYAPGDIPLDIDSIWYEIYSPIEQISPLIIDVNRSNHLHIDQRIDRAEQEQFWRYYASQALRLSLMLICEDIPDTSAGAGLVLPLRKMNTSNKVYRTEDLSKLGISLVGWLGKNRSIHVFLDFEPSFEVASDFRVQPLQIMEKDVPEEKSPEDNTLIVVQRKAKPLTLSSAIVETIRRLLAPLYEDIESWKACFDQGMRDTFYPTTDFSSGSTSSDNILNGLADMVVRLGGQNADGQQRWYFCCVLLPEESALPLQQRSLIVQAQSLRAPHDIGVTSISPEKSVTSISLRAFQSGNIVYRPKIALEDTTIVFREVEGPIHSIVAVPVGGEDGLPIAVLYVASRLEEAFSDNDQQVLRILGRIVEELLITYRTRQRVTNNLRILINNPHMVDRLFDDFFSENRFMSDTEELLINIDRDSKKEGNQLNDEVISFIAIDIDNQSTIAIKYGDQIMRDLNKAVGLRIQELLPAIFSNYVDCKLYRIYADRYYLLLKNISIDQARKKAEQLRQNLSGPISIEQPPYRDSTLVLPDITVHLGVTSYTYTKLADFLRRPQYPSVADISAMMAHTLDLSLKMGIDEGGDVVISWDKDIRGFVRSSPLRK